MRRMKLIEIHDHPRFPAGLRNLVTDALEALWEFGNSYKPILDRLHAGLVASGETPAPVLDLCSGGGGPWLRLAEQLEKKYNCPVTVCLTDKYPNREAIDRVRQRLRAAAPRSEAAYGKGDRAQIDFSGAPVDALRIPDRMRGFRTIFSAFHHFDPAEAQAILASAEASGRGIGVFEVARRGITTMAVLCITPFLVLLLTPLMRPFRWGRLLWTYVLPVVPFVIWYDGWASCLRAYSQVELRELVSGVRRESPAAGYRWQIGEARSGLLPVTYVVGYPEVSRDLLAGEAGRTARQPVRSVM
jgi:hypothetical protein